MSTSTASEKAKISRPQLRALIHKHGGRFHGPRIETLSMPEASFWSFMDEVIGSMLASSQKPADRASDEQDDSR